MSYFNNASAFMAIGNRFSFSLYIRTVNNGEFKVVIDDCHSVEELVDCFDKHIDTIREIIPVNLVAPRDGRHNTALTVSQRWGYCLGNIFDYHEYHHIERFAAIAKFVHMLNEE